MTGKGQNFFCPGFCSAIFLEIKRKPAIKNKMARSTDTKESQEDFGIHWHTSKDILPLFGFVRIRVEIQ